MQEAERRPSGPLVWVLAVLTAVLGLFSRRRAPTPLPGVDPEDLAAGHERSDMRVSLVLATVGTLLVLLLLILILISSFEAALTGVPISISRPQDLIQGLRYPPAPTPAPPELEARSGQTLEAYRAAVAQQMTQYHWVDRQAGVVAIPIDRAMDLVAQRGLPARSEAEAAGAQDNGTSSPSAASAGRVNEASAP